MTSEVIAGTPEAYLPDPSKVLRGDAVLAAWPGLATVAQKAHIMAMAGKKEVMPESMMFDALLALEEVRTRWTSITPGPFLDSVAEYALSDTFGQSPSDSKSIIRDALGIHFDEGDVKRRSLLTASLPYVIRKLEEEQERLYDADDPSLRAEPLLRTVLDYRFVRETPDPRSPLAVRVPEHAGHGDIKWVTSNVPFDPQTGERPIIQTGNPEDAKQLVAQEDYILTGVDNVDGVVTWHLRPLTAVEQTDRLRNQAVRAEESHYYLGDEDEWREKFAERYGDKFMMVILSQRALRVLSAGYPKDPMTGESTRPHKVAVVSKALLDPTRGWKEEDHARGWIWMNPGEPLDPSLGLQQSDKYPKPIDLTRAWGMRAATIPLELTRSLSGDVIDVLMASEACLNDLRREQGHKDASVRASLVRKLASASGEAKQLRSTDIVQEIMGRVVDDPGSLSEPEQAWLRAIIGVCLPRVVVELSIATEGEMRRAQREYEASAHVGSQAVTPQ